MEDNGKLKYLVLGTGGVGGCIASFMALAGKDVECIARGEHLSKINDKGIHLVSYLKGDRQIPMNAYTADNYAGSPDVAFVCVKGYSLDDALQLLRRICTPRTLVIPVLNVYGTAGRLADELPQAMVAGGCIYIIGSKVGAGEITQQGEIFRIVFGQLPQCPVDGSLLGRVEADLAESGIEAILSDDIDRDSFCKWAFISAMACTGAYYDIPMESVQRPGEVRDMFVSLLKEGEMVGKKSGVCMPADHVEKHLAIMDNLDPTATASMQKDIRAGRNSEIESLLFDMIARGNSLGLGMETYRKVAQKLEKYR